jgi:hypothetical protein
VVDNYTFQLIFYLPDGTKEVIYETTLIDDQSIVGEDGIFIFTVGNCDSEGNNDVDVEFPAYLPLPDQAKFKLTGSLYANGYINMVVDGISGTYAIANGSYESWCADKDHHISKNKWYKAKIYSSLNGSYAGITAVKQHYLNWLANHTDGYTDKQIQKAIWAITNGYPGNALSTAAMTHGTYKPKVGEYAFVIFDPIEKECQGEIQLFIVRVDP